MSVPPSDRKEELVSIKPLHVLLLGAGILGSGIVLTGALSYRLAGKQLAAEGIDARLRRRILPHAMKALGGSLLLTGAAAAGGFWVLEGLGLVDPDSPTSKTSLTTAMDMMLRPHALQQQLEKQQEQRQQQQQQEQQVKQQQLSSK